MSANNVSAVTLVENPAGLGMMATRTSLHLRVMREANKEIIVAVHVKIKFRSSDLFIMATTKTTPSNLL